MLKNGSVYLVKVDPANAWHLRQILDEQGYEVCSEKYTAPIGRILGSVAVFMGGDAVDYLPLLRRLRAAGSYLSLIVVARSANTADWLASIEAGATDYLMAPLESTQVLSLLAPVSASLAAIPAAG